MPAGSGMRFEAPLPRPGLPEHNGPLPRPARNPGPGSVIPPRKNAAPPPRPAPVQPKAPVVDQAEREEPPAQIFVETPAQEEAAAKSPRAPFLEEVLDRISNPPAQTAILGVCDDGLPILLDLNDPAPGAVLVASDDDVLRTRLLRALLQTCVALNSPRSVQFLILSSDPGQWQDWLAKQEITRHCLGVEALPASRPSVESPPQGSPDRWLLKLGAWADQRRSGSVTGPAVVLVVDDLNAATQLEYDARVNFDWLVKEGPGVRIWPVVGMRTASAKELIRWVRLFKTRLLGPANDRALFGQLASEPDTTFDPAEFAVRVQDHWLAFRVPVLPDEVY
jgi:hypothetical protein